MISSSADGPQIRKVNYEASRVAAVVECPHCGGPVEIAAAASDREPGQMVTAAAIVVAPDVEPVRRQVAQLLRSVLEVIDGRRPVAQLLGVVAPSACRYARSDRGPGRVSRILSLRAFLPTEAAAEVTAVVAMDGRVRAVAARFELRVGGWCCTVLRIL